MKARVSRVTKWIEARGSRKHRPKVTAKATSIALDSAKPQRKADERAAPRHETRTTIRSGIRSVSQPSSKRPGTLEAGAMSKCVSLLGYRARRHRTHRTIHDGDQRRPIRLGPDLVRVLGQEDGRQKVAAARGENAGSEGPERGSLEERRIEPAARDSRLGRVPHDRNPGLDEAEGNGTEEAPA
jgi:hypothetical protein